MTAHQHPFDDAAPFIRLPVHRGPGRDYGAGDGKAVKVPEPTPDVVRYRGKCPDRCGCPKCRIDAEYEAYQWVDCGCANRWGVHR